MPTLPSIDVTDEQQTRILAAYKSRFETETVAETVAKFKEMIAEMVRNEVLTFERRKLEKEVQLKMQQAEAEVNTFMEV